MPITRDDRDARLARARSSAYGSNESKRLLGGFDAGDREGVVLLGALDGDLGRVVLLEERDGLGLAVGVELKRVLTRDQDHVAVLGALEGAGLGMLGGAFLVLVLAALGVDEDA